MKNLTGVPYHVENQKYMYTHEHGKETVLQVNEVEEEHVRKFKNRIEIEKIIRLTKENCKYMPVGKKYFIGGKNRYFLNINSTNLSILKVNYKSGYIETIRPGRVELILDGVRIPIHVLSQSEYWAYEEKQIEEKWKASKRQKGW